MMSEEIVPLNSQMASTALDSSKFSDDENNKIEQIKQTIDVKNTSSVIQYGVEVQSRISEFADKILYEIRSKDSGFVGELLSNLIFNVKDLGVDGLSEEGFLSKIPIIGSFVSNTKKFLAQYQRLSVQIEKTVDELDKAKMQLLRDIAMLDNLYDKNVEYFKELNYYVAAGDFKVTELKETLLPELKQKAQTSNDPIEAQQYNDMEQLANRFEKRLHDLKLSRMIALQTAPQIRLVQNNNQVLAEKIQSSILNTIPLWKNQIVIAVSLIRQKKALKLQKEVTDTTNELLTKNAELLKTGSIDIARESERGIVDLETLKKVNADLVSTIDETIKIQQEGRVKRIQAEKELVNIEKELKDKLTSLR
ncbi:toxic anion resistance family protein [Candidatus Magnetoovum chiemensis]|nr:toxic anion resistance family protein [Candidatus Magnetoovum chiemensis]